MARSILKTVALVVALAAGSGACALRPAQIRERARAGDRAQLSAWLEHEHSWVREEAARALSRVPGPETARLLEGVLARPEERPWVRAAAAASLGRIQDPGSLPVLVGMLSRPGLANEIKLALVGALCTYHDPRALQAIATLEHGDDLLLSSVAAQARIVCAPHSSP